MKEEPRPRIGSPESFGWLKITSNSLGTIYEKPTGEKHLFRKGLKPLVIRFPNSKKTKVHP